MINVRSTFTRTQAPDLLQVMTDNVCTQLAQEIAVTLRNRWQVLGSQLSRSIRSDYVSGIQAVTLNGTTAVVALVGDTPNEIEHGTPGKDLRKTLLGDKVPTVAPRQGLRGKHQSKKGGYYRAIPFRHGSPGSQGSAGTPMGAAYADSLGSDRAKALGKAIYAAARALAPSTTEPHRVSGSTSRSLATKTPGSKWGGRLRAGIDGVGKLLPHHSTDIYAGMVKLQKTYEGATQSSYMTFRTISTTKTAGWRTKDAPGVDIMKQLERELPDMGRQVIAAFVRSLSGDAPGGDAS